MKLHWGNSIAIVLIIFAIGMGYAVYKAVQQDYDLVTSDYYGEELKYQDRINQKQNALALEGRLKLSLTEDGLLLQMPTDLLGEAAQLAVEMYCVTEADNDFHLNKSDWLVEDIVIPPNQLASGRWVAKVSLSTAERSYYFDPEILIP